jgi:hypothetical protein
MKAIATLTVLVVSGPFLCLTATAADYESLRSVSKPLVAISGTDSRVTKPSYARITTPEDWVRIWVSHLGTTSDNAYRPHLEVDFDRCLVIAIFRGNKVNVRGIQIDSLSETRDSIAIRFNEITYQTEGPVDEYKVPDRPYTFIIVPKTDKTIIVEEHINRSLRGGPPVWKVRARLEEKKEPLTPLRRR